MTRKSKVMPLRFKGGDISRRKGDDCGSKRDRNARGRLVADERALPVNRFFFCSGGGVSAVQSAEESIHLREHLRAGPRLVDRGAQLRSTRHAMRKPGGELLH